MARFEASETIGRPVDEVFPYVGDPGNHLRWMKTALEREMLSEGPVAEGARFRAVNSMMGRTEHVMEVADLEANRRAVFRSVDGPFPVRVSFTTEPTDGGTRVTWVGEPELRGFAKVMAPLMTRKANRELQQSLRALKDLVERGPA